METPNLPAIRALRPAWNKGRIVGQERPLKPKHVWAIRVRLELAENHRDLAQEYARAGPRIFVLPFANVSNDSDQEYFSNGIAEDIITDLSKVSALSVVARSTAFSLKGQSVDVSDVAQRFDVTHVVEGSVRKSGTRLRISTQLVDAATGHPIWAEGGVRRIRTRLCQDSEAAPYAVQIPRHSARAAARLALKRGLLARLRS